MQSLIYELEWHKVELKVERGGFYSHDCCRVWRGSTSLSNKWRTWRTLLYWYAAGEELEELASLHNCHWVSEWQWALSPAMFSLVQPFLSFFQPCPMIYELDAALIVFNPNSFMTMNKLLFLFSCWALIPPLDSSKPVNILSQFKV